MVYFKLLIVPTFDSKDGVEVMDLGRKEKVVIPQTLNMELE